LAVIDGAAISAKFARIIMQVIGDRILSFSGPSLSKFCLMLRQMNAQSFRCVSRNGRIRFNHGRHVKLSITDGIVLVRLAR